MATFTLYPEARKAIHHQESESTIRKFEERRDGLNTGLGKAIMYPFMNFEKSTLFLGQAGTPFDNVLCERVLKKAILHRKNSLFYKTQKGARVRDLFTSLIYTCQMNETNPPNN